MRKLFDKALLNLLGTLSKPMYRLYEKWLWMQIKDGPLPRHIGIIPDGNRRWARTRGYSIHQGHVHGYEKVKEVLTWIWELKIPYVTLFAMSTENCLYRTQEEREKLFQIIENGLYELMNIPEIYENKVRVIVVGKLDLVPDKLRDVALDLMEKTKHHDKYILTIALCYGGRQEIVDAVRKIAQDVVNGLISPSEITEEIFIKYMPTGIMPDLDLLIRTSGEERISNFLLWHSAYSELYFCDAYWPEFRKIDFWRAIRSYQKRERRFGR